MPEPSVSGANVNAGTNMPIEPTIPAENPANVSPVVPKTEEQPQEPQGFKIPEELKFKVDKKTGLKHEKGWISKVVDEKGNLSVEKIVQQIDNLESLKGQKMIAFDWNNAKPEEIKAHLDSIRPESHEVYDFVKGNVAEGTDELIQKLFHEPAIPKPLAKMLFDNYLSIEKAQMARATSKEGFDAELKESFGDNFADVATKAGTALKSVLSPEDLDLLESVPNVYLGLIYRGVNKLISEYAIADTSIGATGANTLKATETMESLNAKSKEAFDYIQSLDRKPHTDEQKSEAIKRYQAIQNEIFKKRGAK